MFWSDSVTCVWGLTPDSPYDPSKLPRARKALRALLDQKGRPLGRVAGEIERLTTSSVKVVFRIDEGPKVRIGEIKFEGNTLFDESELRQALELTKERTMFTVFGGDDMYIKEKLEYDLQVNMMETYRAQGYIFARAGEPIVRIVEAGQGFTPGLSKDQTAVLHYGSSRRG